MKSLLSLFIAITAGCSLLMAQDSPDPLDDYDILKQFFFGDWPKPFELKGWKVEVEAEGSYGGDVYGASWTITETSGDRTYYSKLLFFGPPAHLQLEHCSSKECPRPDEPVLNNTEKEDGPPYLKTDEDGNTFEYQPMIRYGEWHKGVCTFRDFGFFMMSGGDMGGTKFEDCLEHFERISMVKPSK